MLIYLQISNFFFKLWQNSQGLQMSFLLSENVNFICLKRIINCLNSTLILYPIWNCQIVLNIFFLFPLYTDIRLDWLVENVFCFFNFLHVIDIPSLRWKVLIYLRQRSNSFFFKLWQNSQDLRMSMSLSEKYHKLSKCRRNIAPPDKLWLLTNNM